MEAMCLLQYKTLPSTTHRGRKLTHRSNSTPPVLAILTSPAKCPAKTAEPVTVYDDNWFDRLAIHHLSQSVQAATGIKNRKKGYESLIEAATMVAKSFDQKQQQMLVKESEFEGRREKNVVYIKKCRFLEGTNCVGMCTNLCMMPSQKFIKDSFGMPVNMVPNFEDMSCEMIFGQNPPEAADDPALKQPCYRMLSDWLQANN
ncbi:hypothetical protein QJS10_CPA08g00256 [Acorus calamus]|uniref:Beta-carotene isomerase D27-like C-terminal domain-containing protein n=1 Tax=Acorus calamus TaxID=4465 RepID=A0AAV9E9K8_ACOCL|nr:hypothetical protein QJS10_CPA08g00256 [Acorus calamus]